MADDDDQSSEPLHVNKSTTDDEEMEENDSEEESDDDDGDLIGKDLTTSQIETPALPSCYRGADVPKEFTMRRHESVELKTKLRGSHQEALASVIAQAAQAQAQNQFQSPAGPAPPSSAPSSNTLEPRLTPIANSSSLCSAVVSQNNSPDHISAFSSPIVRRHATDGYNWRKYGQKQVKNPQGSRSYYRCTSSQCYAKKIECCDHSNLIMEVIYKGQHNHDPPTKVNRGRESTVALPVTPISVISDMSQPILAPMDTDPSTSSKEVEQDIPPVLPELKRKKSFDSDGDEYKDREEHIDEPEPKQSEKKSSSAAHSGSLPKTAKKPKLVVHAGGDMRISGDGYKWRKYGQKMVKGNPHPRNYYRCTSAGCPVRKHIESAIDSSTGFIITYKGTHDHELPVSKKQPATSSSNLLLATSLASVDSSQSKKVETLSNQESTTQWSVSPEGRLTGEALKVNGEKPLDSPRTLVSIGFEIKPC